MPPHCDTMDGPVVKAAKRALETRNVNLILPYLPKTAEPEMKDIFEKTLHVRQLGIEASTLADQWFFENAVRLHREGEGAPYTGLKPAGLDPGPIIPRAEKAVEEGTAKEVIEFLSHVIQEELDERMRDIVSKKRFDVNDVDAARKYVKAMLGFEVFSHQVYTSIKAGEVHGEEVVVTAGGHTH